MNTNLKRLCLALLLGAIAVGFAACRTAHGFGEDMEKAGEEIQKGTN
jgi:predicted small secreted protein